MRRTQPLRHDALKAHFACLLEDRGAVLICMLAENDADPPFAQQPRQALIAAAERQVPEVFTVELQEVEGVEHRTADSAVAVQCVEDRDAIRSTDHGLAVERERTCPKLRRGAGNRGVTSVPVVAAAREEAHGIAVASDLKPVAVVLDLVDPVGPDGRLGRACRNTGRDEAVGSRQHVSNIGLLSRPATVDLTQRGNCGLGSMYQGVERRFTSRHRSLKTGVIALDQGPSSHAGYGTSRLPGVGLFLPDDDNLPAEFDLTFDYATRHCVTVWRQLNRIGLKYKST
jgi:hypothetical protein